MTEEDSPRIQCSASVAFGRQGRDDNTGVPAVARGLLDGNGDFGEDQLQDEPEPLIVEVEIQGPPPVAEPLEVVEPPPVIQPERTKPVRHRSKPDRYGHNIYET